MASPLSAVQDALGVLTAVGPISSRSSPLSVSIEDLDELFPSLRAQTWSSVLESIKVMRIPSKYTRRLLDELIYGLQVASVLCCRDGDVFYVRLGEWFAVVTQILSHLTIVRDVSEASDIVAPAIVYENYDYLSESIDIVGVEDQEASGTNSGMSLSKLEEVVPLAQTVLYLFSHLPDALFTKDVKNKDVSETNSMVISLALESARMLDGISESQTNFRKVFSSLLNHLAPKFPLFTGNSQVIAPTFNLLLSSRDFCIRLLLVQNAMASKKLTELSNLIETFISSVFFHRDIISNYSLSAIRGQLSVQYATSRYIFPKLQQISFEKSNSKVHQKGLGAYVGILDPRETFEPYKSPVVPGESRLFDALVGKFQVGQGGSNQHGGSIAYQENEFIEDASILRSTPFLLAQYIRALRSNVLSSTDFVETKKVETTEENPSKRRKGAGQDSPSGPSEIQQKLNLSITNTLIQKSDFAFFAELVSVTLGFRLGIMKSSANNVISRVEPNALSGFFLPPLLDTSESSSNLSMKQKLVHLEKSNSVTRSLSALLSVAIESGVYNVHEDSAPHPQTALLSAIGSWLSLLSHNLLEFVENSANSCNNKELNQLRHLCIDGVQGLCASVAALFELSHTVLLADLPQLLKTLFTLASFIDSNSSDSSSSDKSINTVSSHVSALLCHLVRVFGRLRMLDSLWSAYSVLLTFVAESSRDRFVAHHRTKPSKSKVALMKQESRFVISGLVLLQVFLSVEHHTALSLAFRNLPSGQIDEIGEQVLKTASTLAKTAFDVNLRCSSLIPLSVFHSCAVASTFLAEILRQRPCAAASAIASLRMATSAALLPAAILLSLNTPLATTTAKDSRKSTARERSNSNMSDVSGKEDEEEQSVAAVELAALGTTILGAALDVATALNAYPPVSVALGGPLLEASPQLKNPANIHADDDSINSVYTVCTDTLYPFTVAHRRLFNGHSRVVGTELVETAESIGVDVFGTSSTKLGAADDMSISLSTTSSKNQLSSLASVLAAAQGLSATAIGSGLSHGVPSILNLASFSFSQAKSSFNGADSILSFVSARLQLLHTHWYGLQLSIGLSSSSQKENLKLSMDGLLRSLSEKLLDAPPSAASAAALEVAVLHAPLSSTRAFVCSIVDEAIATPITSSLSRSGLQLLQSARLYDLEPPAMFVVQVVAERVRLSVCECARGLVSAAKASTRSPSKPRKSVSASAPGGLSADLVLDLEALRRVRSVLDDSTSSSPVSEGVFDRLTAVKGQLGLPALLPSVVAPPQLAPLVDVELATVMPALQLLDKTLGLMAELPTEAFIQNSRNSEDLSLAAASVVLAVSLAASVKLQTTSAQSGNLKQLGESLRRILLNSVGLLSAFAKFTLPIDAEALDAKKPQISALPGFTAPRELIALHSGDAEREAALASILRWIESLILFFSADNSQTSHLQEGDLLLLKSRLDSCYSAFVREALLYSLISLVVAPTLSTPSKKKEKEKDKRSSSDFIPPVASVVKYVASASPAAISAGLNGVRQAVGLLPHGSVLLSGKKVSQAVLDVLSLSLLPATLSSAVDVKNELKSDDKSEILIAGHRLDSPALFARAVVLADALACVVTLAARRKARSLGSTEASVVEAVQELCSALFEHPFILQSLSSTNSSNQKYNSTAVSGLVGTLLQSLMQALGACESLPFYRVLCAKIVSVPLLKVSSVIAPPTISNVLSRSILGHPIVRHAPLSLLTSLAELASTSIATARSMDQPLEELAPAGLLPLGSALGLCTAVVAHSAASFDAAYFAVAAENSSNDQEDFLPTAEPLGTIPAGEPESTLAEGSYLLKDELLSFVRRILAVLAAAVTRGAALTIPLAFVQVVLAAPRALSLTAHDEGIVFDILSATAALSTAHSARMALQLRALDTKSASSQATSVVSLSGTKHSRLELTWVDVPTPSSTPIMVSAGAFAERYSPSGKDNTQSTAKIAIGLSELPLSELGIDPLLKESASDVLTIASRALHALAKHRKAACLRLMPLVVDLLRALSTLALSTSESAGVTQKYTVPGSEPEPDAYPSRLSLSSYTRVVEEVAKVLKPIRYQAPHILAPLLVLFSSPTRLHYTGIVPVRVRAALEPAIFALFDVCSPREMQMLHSMLEDFNAARVLLKSLHKDYEAHHKFAGKI